MSAALLAAALSSATAQSLPGGAAAQPRLQMPQPSDIGPMFRVEVQAGPRLETVLDAVRRELAANPRAHSDTPFPIAVPAVKVDVLPAS